MKRWKMNWILYSSKTSGSVTTPQPRTPHFELHMGRKLGLGDFSANIAFAMIPTPGGLPPFSCPAILSTHVCLDMNAF
jgi:hypothetical protein